MGAWNLLTRKGRVYIIDFGEVMKRTRNRSIWLTCGNRSACGLFAQVWPSSGIMGRTNGQAAIAAGAASPATRVSPLLAIQPPGSFNLLVQAFFTTQYTPPATMIKAAA